MLTGTIIEPFVAPAHRQNHRAGRQPLTTEEVRRSVGQSDCSHVKVGLTDVDGVLRGKHISKQKFLSALDKGIAFCDVIVGWDCNDQLYDNGYSTGWNTGYPDGKIRVVAEHEDHSI